MNKYKAKKTEVDGILFDSRLESKRYSFLKMMERAGKITDLKLQVPFILIGRFEDYFGNKYRESKYIADFVYRNANGDYVTEDVKSSFMRRNPLYVLKKKLLLSTHAGLIFYEVEDTEDVRGIV
jgi:hypothetical protein